MFQRFFVYVFFQGNIILLRVKCAVDIIGLLFECGNWVVYFQSHTKRFVESVIEVPGEGYRKVATQASYVVGD